MNRNLNVFWGLVLCVGMIVGLTVLTHRSVSESDYGNPNEFYNSSSARTYSHVSSSAAVADGVGVPMRSTSSMRRGGSFVYAPAYTTPNSPIASSPNGSIASSPISYTSSSATAKSFGSGIGAGVSMSGGAVRNAGGSVSMSGGAVSGSFASSPLASSPLASNLSPLTSSPVAITDPAQAAASYEGIGNTTIGGPRGMRGRQKGMPGFGDTWWNWLDTWIKENGAGMGVGDMGGDGYYSGYELDRYDLQKAYNAFIAEYWNSGMGIAPTFDEWLDWYITDAGENGYQFNERTYAWLPVGNILPLLLMALLYTIILFVKRNKTAQL